ncbi:PEP-CTERM sorting domain-containing protein [Rhizobacter sp. Root1221]|uniref:PEP-CTERM sorting domain-containing protein n=1 Tax=Rhizobacter sp. Root1221 TaxID=1736433 RepID=UPI000714B33A|nr:PEP-CTERM sorting domain-containing protein [Rhizobacter sp. Root1221]KQW00075.1 hypothetical protein ASC87_18820 [Rhizobacter sp. Root1221]
MTISKVLRGVFSATIVASVAISTAALAVTSFTLTSSPTSYAGAGQQFSFVESASNAFYVRNFGVADYVNADLWLGGGHNVWGMNFAPALGQPLALGRYEGASWSRTETSPYLTFGGQGRATSGDGWFEVVDLGFNPDGSILRFGVNFETHDNFAADSWNYGQLRFNSDVPLSDRPVPPVPEPATYALMAIGLVFVAVSMRRKQRHELDRHAAEMS